MGEFGCVAQVAVGVADVATAVHMAYEGQQVVKGMEHAFFMYGGSTIVLIFPPGIEVSSTILAKSEFDINSYVQVGDVLGHIPKPLRDSDGSHNPCALSQL